jgi:hypothetical protein
VEAIAKSSCVAKIAVSSPTVAVVSSDVGRSLLRMRYRQFLAVRLLHFSLSL